jgi:hypothetical protein
VDRKTISLCPKCHGRIEANIFEEYGKVFIRKKCRKHGEFTDLYWGDSELYRRFMGFDGIGRKVLNPITNNNKNCPYDCGLCPEHKSSTILANIDVTNRCNQKCPICFANAAVQGYIYEPTLEQIREMMLMLRNEEPVPCPVVQFSGGEPTVREDLPEIISMAKTMGFSQIQIATNGVKLAGSQEYVATLQHAGLNTIYLQFDGLSKEVYCETRGYNALPVKMRALENCRATDMKSVVLVPTLVRGLNDHQVGGIIKFAAKNMDVVRSVNFQPVSFTGRVEDKDLVKNRITIPDLLKSVEEQTDGEITAEDFYPVPCVGSIGQFIEAWRNNPVPFPSCHPVCGAATFVFVDEGRLIPLPTFIDIEGVFELAEKYANDLRENGMSKVKAIAKFSREFLALIDVGRMPKNTSIPKLLFMILKEGNREALAELFRNTLFIGSMHFQDSYNFDRERAQRCVIHYAVPDGRIIPFCTYNVLHRGKVERDFAKIKAVEQYEEDLMVWS